MASTTSTRRSGNYEPVMGTRSPTVISRTSNPGSATANRQSVRTSYPAQPGGLAVQAGTVANATGKGVNSMKESRAREKKDMQNLNERFATYIEKVRFLEAQNKALQTECDRLKKAYDPKKIKDMYETELEQARNIIDDLSKQRADTDVKLVSLEDQLAHEKAQTKDEQERGDDFKEKYEDALAKLRQLQAEMNTLGDRCQNAEDDYKGAKKNMKRIQDDNNRLRNDLDNETAAHINMANKCQSLEEELAFITNVYEQEIRDLQNMANRDNSGDLREYWKGELSKAIREIQNEYDNRLDQMKNDMDTKYNDQIRVIKSSTVNSAPPVDRMNKDEIKKNNTRITNLQSDVTDLKARNAGLQEQVKRLTQELDDKEDLHDAEVKQLQDQIRDLQIEMESVLGEIQTLMDAKLNLELEIAAYKKLLDMEEDRLNTQDKVTIPGGKKSPVDDKITPQKKNSVESAPPMPGARVTVQRSSRGPIAFAEASTNGEYIMVENTASTKNGKVQRLDGWKIKRVDENAATVEYVFENYDLAPGASVKVYSSGYKGKKGSSDVTGRFSSWGNRSNRTYLFDDEGAEKATLDQKYV